MEGHRADIETAHKYRGIHIICRMHPALFIPWRKKSPASHRGNNFAILLVHAGNISFSGKGKPVRIHGLCRALHPCLEHVLQIFAGTVQVLIIQKYNLREQDRLLTSFFPLSFPSHIQKGNGGKAGKPSGANSCRHCDERIVSPAGGHCVKLIFPSLESLFKFTFHIGTGFRPGCLIIQPHAGISFQSPLISLFRIRF